MFYSLWYNAHTMLPVCSLDEVNTPFQATGRQHHGCIIPQAVTQSSAPEDGWDQRLKHVELNVIINKPLLLHLFGVYFIYINDARSDKYQIYFPRCYVCSGWYFVVVNSECFASCSDST